MANEMRIKNGIILETPPTSGSASTNILVRNASGTVETITIGSISGTDSKTTWLDPINNFTGYTDCNSDGNVFRYIATSTASGWTKDYVYQCNGDGSGWTETVVTSGYSVVNLADNQVYLYNGAAWAVNTVTPTSLWSQAGYVIFNTNIGGKVQVKNQLEVGLGASATGTYASAMGPNCLASGNYGSHAEGVFTKALGTNSHAEGYTTTAFGDYGSHAEGKSTSAWGQGSHAEGYFTTASGLYAHAEGVNTKATNNYTHSEGSATTANGINSHAEGGGTKALGNNSHSEGQSTSASGASSHSEGYFSIAIGNGSHAEGGDVFYSATGGTAIGGGSHAEGWGTTAIGGFSHTEGKDTIAVSFYDHAEGNATTASGGNSHSEGANTIAGGANSHAECDGTYASGNSSHAEGVATTSIGTGSHAEGGLTTAISDYTHAEGWNSTAVASLSHAEGGGTTAIGFSSHAGGNTSSASGYTSFVHSFNSHVIADRSAILGGQYITATTSDTVYVPYLNIQSATTDNSLTNVLVKGSDGSIKLRTISTGATGSQTTAFTYSNNTFTITDNGNSAFTATINSVTGLTVNGNLTFTGQSNNPVYTAGTVTATHIPNWNNSNIQTVILSAATTSISGGTNIKNGAVYTMILKQNGTGSRNVTWGAEYKWQSAIPPVLTSSANAVDILTFISDGTSLYGLIAKDFR